MAQRTALLNWNNINRDTDFSKYIESLTTPWVIEWLAVTSSSVAIWKAWVPCERTNGDTIYALFYNTAAVSISWDGDVYIEVDQAIIDNWELWNEDGTGIAEIKVWTMPSKNALKLATISNWTVTDARVFIKKVDELNTEVQTIFTQLEDLDERVEHLEEADAIDHLEESGLVWELYTLNDTLFKQETPTLENSTLDANIWDVADNTQVHIQRIASGVASNQLKLKLKMVWASTQNLVVEVRKWSQVTVTANQEAYWYWSSTVIASGSIPYTSISSDYSEITVTLNNEFWWTKGELLDVVLYMASVNATNYYCIACDETQYSEAFSYVSVNGSTRTRSKLMPYCISNGFAQSLLVKTKNDVVGTIFYSNSGLGSYTSSATATATMPSDWFIAIDFEYYWEWSGYRSNGTIQFYKSSPQVNLILIKWVASTHSFMHYVSDIIYPSWTVININVSGGSSDYMVYAKNIKIRVAKTRLPVVVSGNPTEVKSIWNMWYIIIYWKIWNSYKGGIMIDKDTSATTWAITLWDAVGYIKVNLNGEIVKIPYYNE